MNKAWSMLCVLSVLSVLGVPQLFAAPEDEVKAVFERFVAAQNAHDVRAVEALLLDAPHFLWITHGTPIWGHEAALKRFEALYQGTWHLEPDMPALRVMLLGDTSA
jgi:ketosteroid isomerase-like protein